MLFNNILHVVWSNLLAVTIFERSFKFVQQLRSW